MKTMYVSSLSKTLFRAVYDSNTQIVKPVLSGHSKIDKTKVLKSVYLLMQVKSIVECSQVKSIAECSPLEHSTIFLTCIKQ